MANEIILYQPNETVKLEVRLENETVWLTHEQMGTLFGVDRTVIVRHVNNIYTCGELSSDSTCAKIAQVRNEGGRMVKRSVLWFNLEMIISVGYRVNSIRGIEFRRWATGILKDYLLRGYAVTNRIDRLENDVHELRNQIKEVSVSIQTSLPPREGLFFAGRSMTRSSSSEKSSPPRKPKWIPPTSRASSRS